MTVKLNNRRKEYDGDGIATGFNGPMAYRPTDIVVNLVDIATNVATLQPTSAYTLSGLGRNTGTRVEMNVAPAVGQKIQILLTVPFSQDVNITNQGAFNAEALEQADDLTVMQVQQIDDRQSRSVQFSENLLMSGFDPVIAEAPAAHWLVGVRPDAMGFALLEPPEIATLADETVTDPKVADGANINSDKLAANSTPFTITAVPYLQTQSHLQQGRPVSVFRAIAPAKFAGIRAGTNTDNLFDAFNNLLTEMGTLGYGLLEVPRGEFFLNTPPSLPIPAGVTIRGEGRYATKLKFNAVTNGLRLGNGAEVHNLCVDGLGVSQTGIHADAASRVLVSDVLIQNLVFHGLAITNCVGGQFNNVRVLNCQSRGVIIDPNSSDNELSNIYAEGCGNAGLLIGHNSHHNIVRGLIVVNTGNAGLWIHNASYLNKVIGASIRGTTAPAGTPGILLGYNAQDNLVADFSIESYTIGVLLRGAAADATFALGHTSRNTLADGRIACTGSGVANSAVVLFDSTDGGTTKATDNILSNVIGSNAQYGVREGGAGHALNNDIQGGSFQADITTPYSMTGTSGTKATAVRGITGIGNLGGATPAFPATNVPVTNTFPYPVQIFIAGMPNTGTRVIQINGVNTAASPAPGDGNLVYTLLPGQTITPFYGTGGPSWTWFGMW